MSKSLQFLDVSMDQYLFTDPSRPVLYIELGDSNSEAKMTKDQVRDADVLKYASKGLIWDINASAFVELELGTNSGGTIIQPGRMGAEAYMAAWYWMMTGRQLYIAKQAISGYSLSDTNGQSFHPSAPGTQYSAITNVVSQAVAALTNPYIVVRYMGGTNDALLTESQAADYIYNTSNTNNVGNLQFVLDSVFTDTGITPDRIVVPNLPNSMSQLSDTNRRHINNGVDSYCRLDPTIRYKIDTNPLASFQADFHYDEPGYRAIAEESFKAGFFSGYTQVEDSNDITIVPQTVGVSFQFITIGTQWVSMNVYLPDGTTVELLKAKEFPGGTHSVYWDGLDTTGTPVDVNEHYYEVKMLKSNSITSKICAQIGTTIPFGPEYNDRGIGMDQGVHAAFTWIAGDEFLLSGLGTENLEINVLRFNFDTEAKAWKTEKPRTWQGFMSTCTMDGTLYGITQNSYMMSVNPADGSTGTNYDVSILGSAFGDEEFYQDPYRIAGDDFNDRLVLIYRTDGRIRWYDTLGVQQQEVTGLTDPSAITIDKTNGDTYVAISGGTVLRYAAGGTTSTNFITGLQQIEALAWDATTDELLVYEAGTNKQVKRYNNSAVLQTTYGDVGGRAYGLYDTTAKNNFNGVVHIEVDGAGNFYTCEPETGVRRVAKFNSAGVWQKEFITSTKWGANFQFDPYDHNYVWFQTSLGQLQRVQWSEVTGYGEIHSVMEYKHLHGTDLGGNISSDYSLHVVGHDNERYVIGNLGLQIWHVKDDWTLELVSYYGHQDTFPTAIAALSPNQSNGSKGGGVYLPGENGGTFDTTIEADEVEWHHQERNNPSGRPTLAWNGFWYIPFPIAKDSIEYMMYYSADVIGPSGPTVVETPGFYKYKPVYINDNNVPMFRKRPKGDKVMDLPSFYTGLDLRWSFMPVGAEDGSVIMASNIDTQSGWGNFGDAFVAKYDVDGNLLWKVGNLSDERGFPRQGYRFSIGKTTVGPQEITGFTPFNERTSLYFYNKDGLVISDPLKRFDYVSANYPADLNIHSDPKGADFVYDELSDRYFALISWENCAMVYEILGLDTISTSSKWFVLENRNAGTNPGVVRYADGLAGLSTTIDETPTTEQEIFYYGTLVVPTTKTYEFELVGSGTLNFAIEQEYTPIVTHDVATPAKVLTNYIVLDGDNQTGTASIALTAGEYKFAVVWKPGGHTLKQVRLRWDDTGSQAAIPTTSMKPEIWDLAIAPSTGKGFTLEHFDADDFLTEVGSSSNLNVPGVYLGQRQANDTLDEFGHFTSRIRYFFTAPLTGNYVWYPINATILPDIYVDNVKVYDYLSREIMDEQPTWMVAGTTYEIEMRNIRAGQGPTLNRELLILCEWPDGTIAFPPLTQSEPASMVTAITVNAPAAYQEHLGIQNYDSSRVLLRWDEPTVAADSFRLVSDAGLVTTPTSSTFFYEDTGLTPGSTIVYEVFAVRSGSPNESLGTATVTLPETMTAPSWADFRSRLSTSKLNVNRRGGYGYADLLADESGGSISGVTDGTGNHIGSAYEGALDLANGVVPGGSITATKEACYRVLDSYLDYWIANGLSGGAWKRRYLDDEHLWVAETLAHLGSYIVADKGLTVGTVDVDAMIVKIDSWLDDALIEANPSSKTEIEFFANKGFRLFNLAAIASVTELQADIDKVYEYLTDTFYRSYGLNAQGDPAYHHLGFPVDGNQVFQHNFFGAQTNIYGYGLDWYNKAIHEMMFCFDGGTMQLPANLKEQVQDLLLETRWTTHKNRNLVMTLERQATMNNKSDQFGSIVTSDIDDYLANFTGDADASKDTLLGSYTPSSTTAGHIIGVKAYPNNEMLIVKTAEAMLAAKSTSTRTMTLVSGNGYQTDSFNLVPGAWYYDDEGAYDDLPAYDHRNFAGSLTEQLAEATVPRGTGTARINYSSTNTYAGAVQQGNIAVLAYQHQRAAWNTIEANIAHFGLANCMVTCLSNIQQTGSVGSDVRFTIDQKLWDTANTLTYNTGSGDVTQSSLFAPISTSISSTTWVHVNNMGYVIMPQGTQTLEIWGESRSGNWNTFDSSESSSAVNADIFQLGLNFGTNPSGADAVVIAFPASTPAAVASFAASTGITIDQIDSSAIGITSGSLSAVAFFNSGTVGSITVDQPVLIAKDGSSVAIADPNQTLTSVTYNANTTVNLPQGRYAGLATIFTE